MVRPASWDKCTGCLSGASALKGTEAAWPELRSRHLLGVRLYGMGQLDSSWGDMEGNWGNAHAVRAERTRRSGAAAAGA